MLASLRPPVPADHRPGVAQAPAPPLGSRLACRAAAAAPPAREEQLAAPAAAPAAARAAARPGSYPAQRSWLSYSWRVPGLATAEVDAMLDSLCRQLGVGDRWAWQEEEAEAVEEAGNGADAEEETESGAARQAARRDLPLVPSTRASRRQQQQQDEAASSSSGSAASTRRPSRGRSSWGRVAGAAAGGAGRLRLLGGVDGSLPADLEAHPMGKRLTAEQEACLGEIVQAARLAAKQAAAAGQQTSLLNRQRSGAAASASLAGSQGQQAAVQAASRPQTASQGPAGQQDEASPQQLQRLCRQRNAARHLLLHANLRLVWLARRRLAGGRQLDRSVQEELLLAGRDALWRATAGFHPARHTRFSSYAVAAILNAMRDVLAQQAVHVPRQAAGWGRRVRAAAAAEARSGEAAAAAAAAGGQGQAVQQAEPPKQRSKQQKAVQQGQAAAESTAAAAASPGLHRLAAAAGVSRRQAELGLAATRRQQVVSMAGMVEAGRPGVRLLVRFQDLEEEEAADGEDPLAASDVRASVECLLSRLPPAKKHSHARVLRLRFALEPADGPSENGQQVRRRGRQAAPAASPTAAGTAGGLPAGSAAASPGELVEFTTVGRALGVSRQRAQQLYRAALASARQAAADMGCAFA